MGVGYTTVLWNRQKRRYDRIMAGLIALYLILFVVFHLIFQPEISVETLIIRATATLALLMLHIILLIGPLARLDIRFLPLLYNRRHLGVSMFLIAAVHGVFSIIQFHAAGNVNPIYSLFIANLQYDSIANFPFQVLGFFALLILFLMAATSHDFWLKNLSPTVWKGLHMMVYVAYFLIIMHVMLGAYQEESSPALVALLVVGMVSIITLHLMTGSREAKKDQNTVNILEDGYVEVGDIQEIENNRAKIITANGERIAVFKYDGKLSAVSNVCRHQLGPLGEGKIVDGCITCPWHGYQYLPHNGSSPPPFTEKVETYDLRLQGNKIYVNPKPHPPGMEVTPVSILIEKT